MFKEIDDDHVECQLCDKKILVAWRANHLKKSHPDLTIAGGLDKSKDASNVKIKSEPGIVTNTFFVDLTTGVTLIVKSKHNNDHTCSSRCCQTSAAEEQS